MIKKTYAINLLIPFKISDCDGTEFVDYDGQLKNTYRVVHDIDIGTMLKCIHIEYWMRGNVTGYKAKECLDLMYGNELLLIYSNITSMYGGDLFIHTFCIFYSYTIRVYTTKIM